MSAPASNLLQSYSEKKGKEPINWRDELTKAIRVEPSDYKHFDLDRAAANWVTCACGNICAAIPRNDHGEPMDDELRGLGASFYNRVKHRQWQRASEVLDAIEERSIEVLRRIGRINYPTK